MTASVAGLIRRLLPKPKIRLNSARTPYNMYEFKFDGEEEFVLEVGAGMLEKRGVRLGRTAFVQLGRKEGVFPVSVRSIGSLDGRMETERMIGSILPIPPDAEKAAAAALLAD